MRGIQTRFGVDVNGHGKAARRLWRLCGIRRVLTPLSPAIKGGRLRHGPCNYLSLILRHLAYKLLFYEDKN